MKNVYCLFVVLIISSCSQKKYQQKIESFPVDKLLHAEKIFVDDVIYPGWIMLKEQNLFVIDIKSDTMLYQYSLPELKCISKGGLRGQGKGEFQIAPRFCWTTSRNVYIWGYTPFTIKGFDVVNDYQILEKIQFELPVSDDVANERHIVRDSVLVYNAMPREFAVKKINLNSKQQEGQITFESDNSRQPFFNENRGYMIANDSLVIYAYIFKKQIDFYDLDNLTLKKRLVGNDMTPHIVVDDLENTVFYHQDLVAGKRYFYVKCQDEENNASIEVYDYLGHSIAKYRFDIVPQYFDVDEQNKVIYGYNSNFEDCFLKYSF